MSLKELMRESQRRRLQNLQDEKEKREKVKARAAADPQKPGEYKKSQDVTFYSKPSLADPGTQAAAAAVDSSKKKESPLERWKRKRSSGSLHGLSAGELANLFDGLTPDGCNKEGVKVSFVERGESLTGDRCRISVAIPSCR